MAQQFKTEKTCIDCGETKPRDAFPSKYRKGQPRAVRSRCSPCHENHRNAVKRYRISGTRAKEIREMPCSICSKPGPSVIDHNHSTGKVRGPLCNGCNRGIGFFNDDIDKLQAAIAYLEYTG